MDIIQRNLFRLLRSGAFETNEEIEPMSAFKWERLYQLALLHNVVPETYKGILACQDQFFMRLTDKQQAQWQNANYEATHKTTDLEEDELLRPDLLTNPILNSKLQNILDDEHSDTNTRQALLLIIKVMRHIFNEGTPIHELLELARFLKQKDHPVDYDTLKKWLSNLRMNKIAQLEGRLLVLLYGFSEDEIPFLSDKKDKNSTKIAGELLECTNTRSHNWYFSQDEDSIFVHNSNTSAMFSHVRRTARYFSFYPSESITNFFASFVHSLSHIEE